MCSMRLTARSRDDRAVVEQKLPFVRRVCERFCIMDKGRIVASGEMPELTDGLVKTYLSV